MGPKKKKVQQRNMALLSGSSSSSGTKSGKSKEKRFTCVELGRKVAACAKSPECAAKKFFRMNKTLATVTVVDPSGTRSVFNTRSWTQVRQSSKFVAKTSKTQHVRSRWDAELSDGD